MNLWFQKIKGIEENDKTGNDASISAKTAIVRLVLALVERFIASSRITLWHDTLVGGGVRFFQRVSVYDWVYSETKSKLKFWCIFLKHFRLVRDPINCNLGMVGFFTPNYYTKFKHDEEFRNKSLPINLISSHSEKSAAALLSSQVLKYPSIQEAWGG